MSQQPRPSLFRRLAGRIKRALTTMTYGGTIRRK